MPIKKNSGRQDLIVASLFIGFADPSRTPDQTNVWIDWVSGAVVRQGLPARIERV